MFDVTYSPPAPSPSRNTLELSTNDPDPAHADLQILLITEDGARLDVGDALTEEFGFLDPNGAGQLSSLEGKVVVLAYFALF